MDKYFVPYKLAMELKNLGFNDLCIRFYGKDKCTLNPSQMWHMDFCQNNFKTHPRREEAGYCAAPLYDQVLDWFEEKFRWEIVPYSADSGGWVYYIGYCNPPHARIWQTGNFSTRKEAIVEGIRKAIELLKTNKYHQK